MLGSHSAAPWSAQPTSNFYLDESGNSGDLVKAGRAFDFGQQPVFAVVGVGIDDEDALAIALPQIRTRHRIRSREIKSSALKNKLGVVVELIAHLRSIGSTRSSSSLFARRSMPARHAVEKDSQDRRLVGAPAIPCHARRATFQELTLAVHELAAERTYPPLSLLQESL